MKNAWIAAVASVVLGVTSSQTMAGGKMSVYTHVENSYAVAYVYGKNGSPVSGARVVLENLNNDIVEEQRTNSVGKAVLRLPTVSQNVSGYVKAKGRKTEHFELSPDFSDHR